jgi:hypothetical protein
VLFSGSIYIQPEWPAAVIYEQHMVCVVDEADHDRRDEDDRRTPAQATTALAYHVMPHVCFRPGDHLRMNPATPLHQEFPPKLEASTDIHRIPADFEPRIAPCAPRAAKKAIEAGVDGTGWADQRKAPQVVSNPD